MFTYKLDIEATINPNDMSADVKTLTYEAKLFSLSLDFQISNQWTPGLINVKFSFQEKYAKQDLTERVTEQLKNNLRNEVTLTDEQALVFARQIVADIEAICPKAIKQPWRTQLKQPFNTLSNFLGDQFSKIRSFNPANVYIPRRYLRSPTWGGTLFRLAMACLLAAPAYALAKVFGTGLIISSAAAITSGLLGYTGIAYRLQRMFYGEKFVSFNIDATTKAPYRSVLNFSGRNSKTPYLRTLAGVEQDFSYLLQSSVERQHLPLLARYHAATAAQTFPLCFYENELPKVNEVSELEKEVRQKLPTYLPRR